MRVAMLLLIAGCSRAHGRDAPADADVPDASRVVGLCGEEIGRVSVALVPTRHVQMAIWTEDEHGALVRTRYLTQSVALRGIGNRPGASQMNSGFKWPYGRRETVLSAWAHRRAESAISTKTGTPSRTKSRAVLGGCVR